MTMEVFTNNPYMENNMPDGQEALDRQELPETASELEGVVSDEQDNHDCQEPAETETPPEPEEPPKKKRASRKKTEKTAEEAQEVDNAVEDLPAEDDGLDPGDGTASDEADQFIVMGLAGETPVEPDLAAPVLEADEVSEVLEAEPLLEDAVDGIPGPVASLPEVRSPTRPRPASEPVRPRTAEPHASLLSLKLNRLDRDLTEQERQEWNDIYASFRSKSVLTGKIIGVDRHTFNVRNRETGLLERRVMHCAVMIRYRVKVLIPETEMWLPGQERPSHVLRNMTGAEVGYTVLDVDRKGGVAIASRRMAAVSLCRAFDNVRGGHFVGERLPCRVLTVGPNRCLLECGGRDLTLGYRDMLYASCPDLRERFRPGDQLECILKEYNRRSGAFAVSVKESQPHPFIGVTVRHPLGSRRQATISGKYGGGVFCTMADDTTCLCLYTALHTDRDFQIGDEVLLVVSKYDYEQCLIYGRILSKW